MAAALAGTFAENSASATVTATESGGILTITVGANGDNPTLSTTTSGGNIHVVGVGFTGDFAGVTQIHINYAANGETATLDSTNFSFNAPVTITDTGGTGNDSVTKNGPNNVTLTGASTYGSGTGINGGTVTISSGIALGTGVVQLKTGGELRGTGTATVGNEIDLLTGTNTLSTNGTFTVSNLVLQGDVNFGSKGNAGTVVVTSNPGSVSATSSIEVAYGTLKNGGGLGYYTNGAAGTVVDTGATLSVNDQSMTIGDLFGAGSVTLGTKATTLLTLTSANFGGVISGAGAVTITGGATLGGTNTYTGGTTISGGALAIGGGGTTGSVVGNITDNASLIFSRSNAVTFGGIISGTGKVTQGGSGVLTLSGNNTYLGGTDVHTGVLLASNAKALSTGKVTIDTGAELRTTGTTILNNEISFAATGVSTLSTNGTLTVGNLDVQGNATFGSPGNAGAVVITGVRSFGGLYTLTVANGTLRDGGGLEPLTNSAVSTTVNAGATLDVSNQGVSIASLQGSGKVILGTNPANVLNLDSASFSGVISGAGGLMTTAPYDVLLDGANTYTGGTTVTAGATLRIGGGGATGSIVGDMTLNSYLVFNRTNAYTFAGKISGIGSLTQDGTGTVTLSGNNTYSGGTTVHSGVLIASNSNALGTGNVTLEDASELRTTGTVTLLNDIIWPSGSRSNGDPEAATLSTNGTLTISSFKLQEQVVFGSPGNAGTIIIASGGNPAFSDKAQVEVAYGTLRNGGSLGLLTEFTSNTTVDAGATLDFNDQGGEINALFGTGSVKLGTKAGTMLTVDISNFGGVISGAGGVTFNGLNMIYGTNTYTGGTTINSGATLDLGFGNPTGSVVGNIVNNGKLNFAVSKASTYSGVISGMGEVDVQLGVETLTGNNTYTGGTFVFGGGVLAITSSNAAGPDLSKVTLNDGSELRGIGSFTLDHNLYFPSTGTATLSTTGTLTVFAAQFQSNVVFGSKGNAGTIVLGGGNSYTSPPALTIEVAYGTLRESSGGNVSLLTSGASTTTVDAGATLDAADFNVTIQDLLGAGSVKLGTKASTTLTLQGGFFGGVISGAGQVKVTGLATLYGTNTYTGGTTVDTNGTLNIGYHGSTGSVPGNITNNHFLVFDLGNGSTYGGIISGSGEVEQQGPGVLTLSGKNTYSGGTFILSGSVLAITNPNAVGPDLSIITLASSSELRALGSFTLTDNLRFAANVSTISTTGTLTLNEAQFQGNVIFGSKGNAGTIVMGGGSSSTGTYYLDVAYGTLREGASGAANLDFLTRGATSTTVDAGARLDLNDQPVTVKNLEGTGSVTLGTKASTILTLQDGSTFGGVISGAGQVTIDGVVSFLGANTYTGGTTIDGNGSLYIGSNGSSGSVIGNITDNYLLSFYRSDALTYGGIISGTGEVDQDGTGVLTLSGKNTYSGNTYISTSKVVAITNGNALGTGKVDLNDLSELRGSGTFTLANEITSLGSGKFTLSSTGTMTVSDLVFNNTAQTLHIGSAGNAGTIAVGNLGADATATSTAAIVVDFGTLRNAGGLDYYTSNLASTTVNSGAKLDVNDQSLEVFQLLGAGSVTIGSKATTTLTLDRANFSGVISGAGKVITGASVTLSGASTYTGGTTLGIGKTIVKNTTGSALGTGPVSIGNGSTLGGNGRISGAITLNHSGLIEPGVGSVGTAGTILHGSSMIWNGGGSLDFQIGTTADELILTGALTKGLAGTFDIEIDDAGITPGNYTIATFASTTFAPTDFTLQLPNNVSGMLVDNGHSLVVDITTGEHLPHTESLAATNVAPQDTVATPPTFAMTPTPEPTSATLLAFGGSAVLGWRRRRQFQ